ncbi:L-serine ammonia-lyase, iron-sulfur-dependent subunit beta [Paenibacillus elgii]
MRFKHVFTIIGPAMVGPSSSHTAGAVRIGRVARQLLGCSPEKARVLLYESFAETYWGHGTDLAIAGGLLDYDTDDPRIPDVLDEARSLGIEITFEPGTGAAPHPNTAKIELWSGDRYAEVLGASIGGGNIEIHSLNGFDVSCTGQYPMLVIKHSDRTGILASITKVVSEAGINIGFMDVDRKGRQGEAMTVIEMDSAPPEGTLDSICLLADVADAKIIDLAQRSRRA